jgi:hypothetical protein
VPLPTDLTEINFDIRRLRSLLVANGFSTGLLDSIATRALRSGRRQTGDFQSNRHSRWTLINNDPVIGTDPQYAPEVDCKNIFIILLLTTLEFRNATVIVDPILTELFTKYLGRSIQPGSMKDSLLLEYLDFNILLEEAISPTHGHSSFHIGHIDPKRVPKHSPENVAWRSWRSNLIQGDMTLRQARIYIIKLIGRYFELGELDINDQ